MEKHSESRLSYLFAHLHLLSSDLVSSDSSHLCFSTVHIVGSFTSKLPSKRVILASHLSQSLYASPHGFFAPHEDGENAEAMQAWQCDGCHVGPKVHCRLAYQPKLWLCLVSFGKSSFFSLRSLDHWRQSNSVILMS